MAKKQRPRPPRGTRFAPERSDEVITLVEFGEYPAESDSLGCFVEVDNDSVFIHTPDDSVSVPLGALVFALRMHHWRSEK